MYRQGTLVRRWVPVRTSGGVATVCDLMTGTTITPSGDGAFIAGPDFADFDVYVVDQAWDGEPRHAPKPFVAATNRTTGVALEPGRDYTVTYTNNAAEGWARAIVSGAKIQSAATVAARKSQSGQSRHGPRRERGTCVERVGMGAIVPERLPPRNAPENPAGSAAIALTACATPGV